MWNLRVIPDNNNNNNSWFLVKVSPAQSVKLESYIRQLERQGISRVCWSWWSCWSWCWWSSWSSLALTSVNGDRDHWSRWPDLDFLFSFWFLISSLAGENVHRDHDGLPDILGSSLRRHLGQLHRRLEGSQEIHGTRGSKYNCLYSLRPTVSRILSIFFLFGAFPFMQKAVGGFPLITFVRWQSTWPSCMPS